MNFPLMIVMLSLLLSSAFGQMGEIPPLPRWSDEDAQSLLEGEELLSDMLFRPVDDADVTAAVLAGVSLPPPPLMEESIAAELSEDILAKYFSQKPKNFLIDPQKTLSRQEYRDRLSFLRYHKNDSSVEIYVYLFDEEQKLPADLTLEKVWRDHFADSVPTVLVWYFMGDPSRSEIFVSPDLMKSVGRAERARALQSAIKNARVKSEAPDQLDGFCEQLSTRIYWMEKAMKAGVVAPPDEWEKEAGNSAYRQWLAIIREWWKRWGLHVGIALATLTVALLWGMWHRSRRSYRFPVFAVPHRLGCEHAAGVGAVISFSHSHLSAQAQREKPPGEWDLL